MRSRCLVFDADFLAGHGIIINACGFEFVRFSGSNCRWLQLPNYIFYTWSIHLPCSRRFYMSRLSFLPLKKYNKKILFHLFCQHRKKRHCIPLIQVAGQYFGAGILILFEKLFCFAFSRLKDCHG